MDIQMDQQQYNTLATHALLIVLNLQKSYCRDERPRNLPSGEMQHTRRIASQSDPLPSRILSSQLKQSDWH
jgi:hypothetical protein